MIQKNASQFQAVLTTGPPKRVKPGPSPDTDAGVQVVRTLLENGFLFQRQK